MSLDSGIKRGDDVSGVSGVLDWDYFGGGGRESAREDACWSEERHSGSLHDEGRSVMSDVRTGNEKIQRLTQTS